MKTKIIILSLFIGFNFLSNSLLAAEKQSYKVKGMHCGGCVRTIKASICELPGMKNCSVKLGEITFEMTGEKKYSLPELNKILKTKGEYELY